MSQNPHMSQTSPEDQAMTSEDLRTLIRHARLASGLSRRDVAKILGVHPHTVANAEKGLNLETAAKVLSIVEACGREWFTRPDHSCIPHAQRITSRVLKRKRRSRRMPSTR